MTELHQKRSRHSDLYKRRKYNWILYLLSHKRTEVVQQFLSPKAFHSCPQLYTIAWNKALIIMLHAFLVFSNIEKKGRARNSKCIANLINSMLLIFFVFINQCNFTGAF